METAYPILKKIREAGLRAEAENKAKPTETTTETKTESVVAPKKSSKELFELTRKLQVIEKEIASLENGSRSENNYSETQSGVEIIFMEFIQYYQSRLDELYAEREDLKDKIRRLKNV